MLTRTQTLEICYILYRKCYFLQSRVYVLSIDGISPEIEGDYCEIVAIYLEILATYSKIVATYLGELQHNIRQEAEIFRTHGYDTTSGKKWDFNFKYIIIYIIYYNILKTNITI